MQETHLSLTWDAYQNNICSGLSGLQQRGEFVDMTIAADGHHVKVHQMVLSLVSPYIKDLISSAQCPHPVIFLNNISYTTLCAILQYIYTGEVLVPKEKLPDLLAAGKALHIKGLKEVAETNSSQSDVTESSPPKKTLLKKYQQKEIEDMEASDIKTQNTDIQPMCEIFVATEHDEDEDMADSSIDIKDNTSYCVPDSKESIKTEVEKETLVSNKNREYKIKGDIQYSISNQAGLQVIVNRYIYNLKYVQKNLDRYWRCTDYAYRKCPASVYTNDQNQVIKRKCNHNHPFHDQKIMKKLRLGTIYTAYNEAQDQARNKKNDTNVVLLPCPPDDKTEETE